MMSGQQPNKSFKPTPLRGAAQFKRWALKGKYPMPVGRRMVLFGLVGGATFLLPIESGARRRRRVSIGGRGLAAGAKHSGPVLTREQLRQCVAEQNQINGQEEAVERIQSLLQADEAKINALEDRIAAAEPRVDVYSQQSVNSFNALINEHRRLVGAYNSRLPTVNARVDALNAAVDRFNARCAERAYYERDMAAVLGGR